ncbi:hypothetical protein BGZ80_011437 [Entomortierella chlamydospora]|uniref:tripeptidyl-peptidase II n=1 Tax=Entomortierella chlamydospora TaxID=101097 RepID=A0A9P6N3W2_9FUNG|nr:hypothetical protein BGZ79_004183 [Entomortierella chlamydospora]KAG0022702.1 hypothetical protein BGZ80_011437 [Entomortierella chlamydospora]
MKAYLTLSFLTTSFFSVIQHPVIFDTDSMFHFIRTVIFVIALNCVIAGPIFDPRSLGGFNLYVKFRNLLNIPDPWVYQEPAPLDNIINLRIGLKLQNVEKFHQKVIDISTPGSSIYGLHMTQDQIDAMLKPADGSATLVLEWLKSFGIIGVHDNQWVTADVTVSQAQDLLKTQYNVYRNTIDSKTITRTQSYSLPSILLDSVDLIQPTTMFGMRPLASTILKGDITQLGSFGVASSDIENCNKTASISCIQKLYRTSTYISSSSAKIGVAGFLEEFANNADYQTFCKTYQPKCTGSSYATVQINGGGNNQSDPGLEANLDIQFVSGLAFPNPVTFYSVGGSPPFHPDKLTPTNTNEPYLDFLGFLLGQYKIPQTISISYGDVEQTVPKDYAERTCNMFAQLGAKGTSVIVSSGDGGVQESPANDGTEETRFNPIFPASCPFVTSVGATRYISPEQAANFSSGGFSNYFGRPEYQERAVSQFLGGLGEKYNGLYNKAGRGFPDVSAQGVNCLIVQGGKPVLVGGTSCSAPIFAAIVSLINDDRLAHGKSPMGFLNPWLYSTNGISALTDITKGSNPGTGPRGFDAGVGWDPVTGLGTPDLIKMQAVAP